MECLSSATLLQLRPKCLDELKLVRGDTRSLIQVIATAGETFAERLRAMGAEITSYDDGMVARVMKIAGKSVDKVLDTAPVRGLNRTIKRFEEFGACSRHAY